MLRDFLADLGTVLFWTAVGLVVLLAVLLALLVFHGYSDLNSWLHPF